MSKKLPKHQTQGVVLPTLEDWQQNNPNVQPVPDFNQWYQNNSIPYKQLPQPSQPMKRDFDFTQPNGWGLGIMGAYVGSKMLLNKSNDRNYEAYKKRWIRDYNIPSLIQDPNKFSSEMYESPIYQTGGSVPTMQDSLALYNNSKNVYNYYNNPKYSRKSIESVKFVDIHKLNDERYNSFYGPGQLGRAMTPTGRDTYISDYRTDVDENVYYQRESANSILDTRSPKVRYDRRIQPQKLFSGSNEVANDPMHGDAVSIPLYDPIAVKPWSMLTPKEKEIRIKEYGYNKIPGTTSPVTDRTKIRPRPFDFDGNKFTPRFKEHTPVDESTPDIAGVLGPGDFPLKKGPDRTTPTKYSYTFPVDGYNKDQKLYFKDEKEWKDFLKGRKGYSSQQGSDYGSATGNLQQGGNVPTTQDSLSLYNNAKAVQAYYNKTGNYKKNENDYVFDLESTQNVNDQINNTYKEYVDHYSRRSIFSNKTQIKPNNYRVNLDNNRFLQRESQFYILDPRAPMTMFDKRIKPQRKQIYTNINENDEYKGDAIDIYSYDPIAVKPWKYLTPEEKKIRIERYGYPPNDSPGSTAKDLPVSTPVSTSKPIEFENIKFTPRFKQHSPIESSEPDIRGVLGPGDFPLKAVQNSHDIPSKYSFTYPTNGYNQHETIYFKNKEEWKQFLKGHNVSSQEGDDYGTATGNLKKGGIYIKPENRGKFNATKKRTGKTTEELTHSKNPVTRKRAIFAQNAAKWNHKTGGLTMNTPEDQAQGYFAYPNASSLTFPGSGPRTFVPGPFPLLVKDQNGTQIMTNKPIKTMGKVTEIPIFKDGGEVRKVAPKVKREDATIEAQKGEIILGAGLPGSIEDAEDRIGAGLYSIGGNLHSNGGTPLKAHPGDFVFSNEKSLAPSEDITEKIVGKEIKKEKDRTPAKLAKKYMDFNKFLAMAQDDELDPITKKTAILNVNNYMDKLAEIAHAQEAKKGFPNGVPDFVQASLNTRFDAQGLQEDLNQFKMGGQVQKYQRAGVVTDDVFDRARKVDQVPSGYNLYGTRGNRTFYNMEGSAAMSVPQGIPGGTPGKPWEQFIINSLQSGVTIDELVRKKHGTPEGLQKYSQYYKPAGADDYVFTSQNTKIPRMMEYPNFDKLTPDIPPRMGVNLPGLGTPTPSESDFPTYTEIPNQRFNVNLAEATNLLAAWTPSESRYPPAFRNYEIQNAKAQIASTGRPISEQPYLNAIQRSQLGFDQNNNPYGAAGATRGLGAFQASLGTQNQAISQVYNQNIARQDQRAGQLAQLEIQDGVDRITNAERYDNKLEMLANNKELEAKDRLRNTSNIFNQMVSDREQKRLFNVMSEWYQINPNGSIGMKPVYQIENGKLVQKDRNVRDLVMSQQRASMQYNPAIQLAQQLESMGYDRSDIARILSRSVDDYDKSRTR